MTATRLTRPTSLILPAVPLACALSRSQSQETVRACVHTAYNTYNAGARAHVRAFFFQQEVDRSNGRRRGPDCAISAFLALGLN